MSGGAFDYINMSDFIDVIQEALADNIERGMDGHGIIYKNFSQETINILIDTIAELEVMDKKLHAIDYLLEGDSSEETFLKEWKEIK